MWQTQASIDVAALPQIVYDYLADLRRHKEWSLGVEEINLVKGDRIEVGAEFKAEERVPMKFTSFSRITRLEPPSRIEWLAWDGRMFEVKWSFELRPTGSTTRVTQVARFEPRNILARALLLAIRKRQIPKENIKSLKRLKDCVEASSSVGAVHPQTR